MKLFYSPGACSLSPHIILHETGLPHETVKVDLASKKTAAGDDYFAVNPKGQVPALVLDNGTVLTEASVVVQYLADRKPDLKLVPANGDPERYKVQEWLNYITAEVHKAFSPLFGADTPDAYKDIAKKKLNKQFAYIEKQLASRPYIAGDRFTVADAYLFTLSNWTQPTKIDLSPFPNVLAWRKRVGARPAVQAAMIAEGLIQKPAAA